jgi:hypothetical protein
VDIISQLSFEKEQVSQGYALVLFLQARVIKGMVDDNKERDTIFISCL